MPALPEGAGSTEREFHHWCGEELERRRSRDLDLDEERFGRAVAFVLRRLASDGGES
jgi:hypothetical protein